MNEANRDNEAAKLAWNQNATFWGKRMGEGNDFFNHLIWPATERLLQPRSDATYLDVAAGTGVSSRRLAKVGARVIACDFAEEMIGVAKQTPSTGHIEWRVLDATDEDALVSLGPAFDGVLCNMALMDIAELGPLMRAVPRLLRPGGAFVFSISHPCFNNDAIVHVAELAERDGEFRTTYSVKVSRYRTPFTRKGIAMHDQPALHPCFHRSIGDLLAAGFEAGLVVDGLEESAFDPDVKTGTTALSWSGRFSEIPPVLVVRMRPAS